MNFSHPPKQTQRSLWLRVAALTACAGLSSVALAMDPAECYVRPEVVSEPVDVTSSEVLLSARRADLQPEGVSTLTGDVTVSYQGRVITADSARYDALTQKFDVDGNVKLNSPNLRVQGSDAEFSSLTDEGSFSQASFELLDRNGRGDAGRIEVRENNKLILRDVRYTACPQGQNDWRFVAPELQIDRDNQIGTGRNVRVEFKGVPILYTPFISFPVGDARKSGLLLPNFGTNDRSGMDIALPYYWNIAPNYDAMITPRYLSKRGAQIGVDARYLFANTEGEFEVQYLPNDDLTDSDRALGRWVHSSKFGNGVRFEVDAEDVSDGEYFEDLSGSLAGASLTHLERVVEIARDGRYVSMGIRGQAFNTLDDTILDINEPYKRLPQIWFSSQFGGPNRFSGRLRGDITNFEREIGARGWRADLQPSLSWPINGNAYSLEPRVSLVHTEYDLKEVNFAGQAERQTRTVPIYSLDGQLFFERLVGSNGERRQTLEPRVRYTHIPFVDQNDIPIFDSGNPDVNLVQLFRDNRYTSVDRIGDTDQLSVGLTTRLFDDRNGRELLTATLGQALFFGQRSVRLPGESIEGNSSNLIAEIGLGLSRSWRADLEYQWQPEDQETARAIVRLQYRPGGNKVLNLSYRFQRNDLEQSDLSFAWPIGDNWNIVGRWNYSLDEQRTLERFAGVEYSRCCWSARLVSRRFLNNRSGGQDTALFAQIELKGLTSIGARVDAFLERGILGYGQDIE
ncbi:MAG: LPS-assembly protein LptD [Gammaproteobacteria bacterium]